MHSRFVQVLVPLLLLLLLLAMAPRISGCHSAGTCGCCCRRHRVAGTKTAVLDMNAEVMDENGGEGVGDPEKRPRIYGLSIWHQPLAEKVAVNQSWITDPNALFGQCCAERQLPAACQSHCNFGAYNTEFVYSVMGQRDECPLEYLNEIQFCAAQGRDHRRCCFHRGVHRTIAGPKCLVFCDQRPDRYTRLDFTYLPCLDALEPIKQCFHDEVRQAAFAELLGHRQKASAARRFPYYLSEPFPN